MTDDVYVVEVPVPERRYRPDDDRRDDKPRHADLLYR